ncbi:multiple monosaccharide ABC transporter permease [Carnobacteriaceae bacterium 52-44]
MDMTETSNEKNIFEKLKNNFEKYSMYYILGLIVILFQFLTDGILLKPLNITNIILQNGYVLILAIGMLLVIILGDVDLSVGSIVAFVGAMSAIFSVRMGFSTPVTILLSLGIGILIGAFNGFWVAYVRVPAFIATLASLLIFRGLTIVVLDGRTIAPFPVSFQRLGSGFVPDLLNGETWHLFTVFLGVLIVLLYVGGSFYTRKKRIDREAPVENMSVFLLKRIAVAIALLTITYVMAAYEGFPNILIILTFLILIYRFFTTSTTAGRRLYATGGNEPAAALSGINTRRVKFLAFVNMGFLSAIAGLVFAARLNAATATAGNGFELDAIAAAYIGGASASGGVGTVIGAIIGGLVMGVLNNGMSIMGIGVDWQQAIKGLVLLLAVTLDIYNENKTK